MTKKYCRRKTKANSVTLEPFIPINSTILTEEQRLNLINLTGLNKTSFILLYRSSIDGFDPSVFHSKCYDAAGTLTVIKTKNSNIFGGYTSADWSGDGYKSDSTAFLFSLVNSYNVSVKMNVSRTYYAIYSSPTYGIAFGGGYDLFCSYDQCYSYLGNSYQLPSFLTYGTNEAKSFLGGSYNFQPVEIEVYRINRINILISYFLFI